MIWNVHDWLVDIEIIPERHRWAAGWDKDNILIENDKCLEYAMAFVKVTFLFMDEKVYVCNSSNRIAYHTMLLVLIETGMPRVLPSIPFPE